MIYREYIPHPLLRSHIDAYWRAENKQAAPAESRIMPDGCIDLIINLGDTYPADSGELVMEPEKTYIVGTMTRYKDISSTAGMQLLGIRFKPGAFSHFFRFASLHELTDKTTRFDRSLLQDLCPGSPGWIERVDRFLLDKITTPRFSLLPVIRDVSEQGNSNIADLAAKHFITVRQLERYFKEQMGISPKQYINFIRYQAAARQIKATYPKKTLADIAFDTGYYDHAHLCNEFKKYTGLLPSAV